MEKCVTCGHKPQHIKNCHELLQIIAAGVNHYSNHHVYNLEVTFTDEGEEVLTTDVATALDYLANDIYWNEEGDWSNANSAEVRVM